MFKSIHNGHIMSSQQLGDRIEKYIIVTASDDYEHDLKSIIDPETRQPVKFTRQRGNGTIVWKIQGSPQAIEAAKKVVNTSFTPIECCTGHDGVGTIYEFSVHKIHAKPHRTNAIYLFCRIQDEHYVPVYIDAADDLHNKLVGHARLVEAVGWGATHLLTHSCDVDYLEVASRFIAHYKPILNVPPRTQSRWPQEPLSSCRVSPPPTYMEIDMSIAQRALRAND